MNEDYNAGCMSIVEDYIKHLNRDRMMGMCDALAELHDVDVTEVVNEVDAIYVAEFGDLY